MLKMIALTSLALLGLSLVARPVSAGVFPYKVRRTTLDNGLKVLMIPMPSEGLVSYWSVVRTGARDEVEEGVTGFAHFFEHMMFRGSEKYPGDVYDGIVTSMGADANAYTTDDLTAYHLTLTREDLPTVIEIEADRFQNLQYTREDFKTESGAVYGEYRKGKTSPGFVLYEATVNEAFDRHTYRHTTIGFEADIKKMPEQFDYSRTFFDRYYRPENVVILVVGDFDPDATLAAIRKQYAGWKPGYIAPEIPVEPPQTEQKRIDVPFDGKTLPVVSLNFRGERFLPDDPTFAAASLLGEIAFGETSDLYRKLVLEEQRVEELDAFFGFYNGFYIGFNRDPKLWSVDAMVKDPGDLHAVEAEIWAAIQRLQKEPISPERLDATRSRIKYGFLSRLSTPYQVASRIARIVAISGDMEAIDRLFATYEKLTPADLQRAARTFLAPERTTVAVLHSADQTIPAPAAVAAGGPAEAMPADLPESVLMPVANDPNVVFKIWVRAGSQNDPPGREGLAALTAAMVTEAGTTVNSYDQILAKLFPLAASYDARIDKEMTVLTGMAHRDVAEAFYRLFAEAMLQPAFRSEDLERLRSSALNEIEKNLRYSSDEELGKAALFGRVFDGTRYGHLHEGTVAGLKAITIEDVKRFHAAHYTRDNLVFALGGAYDDALQQRFGSDLNRLPSGRPAPVDPPRPAPIDGRRVVLVEKPGTSSTAISFGYPIELRRGSRDFYALWIANSWLGEHRNSVSHLYQVIREDRGMNYGDYSYIEAFPEGGRRSMPPTGVGRRQQMFEVWIRPVPENRALFALRAAMREVEGLARDGLTAEQFETQRTFLKKYCLQFATNTATRLGYGVDDRFYGIEEGHLARFRRMMDEITLEEVNAAIRKYIRPDDLVIAMVTGDAAAMKKALVAGTPTPIDYGDVPKPDDILAADGQIAAHPLRIKARAIEIIPVETIFAD